MISKFNEWKLKTHRIAWYRIKALFLKEFLLIRRDPQIFISAIVFPLIEVIIFAVLFNMNPRHLSTSVLMGEQTPMARSVVSAFKNSNYFLINHFPKSEKEANYALYSGKSQFILKIPPGFSQDVIRGRRPNILLIADGSIPLTVSGAISSVGGIAEHALLYDLQGTVTQKQNPRSPFNIIVQEHYNPSIIATRYTVPCLISIALVLTMVVLSSASIAKEKGDGTMESLLATPARPIEVIISKMMPYFTLGYIQFILILLIARIIFATPFEGSFFLILFVAFFLIGACLGVGLTISASSKNVSNALQLASQFFALNVLFSGFLFPFQGMPAWARFIGNLFPVTHFMRINLGITLKGSTLTDIWPDLWPIIVFMLIFIFIGVKRYQQTLD